MRQRLLAILPTALFFQALRKIWRVLKNRITPETRYLGEMRLLGAWESLRVNFCSTMSRSLEPSHEGKARRLAFVLPWYGRNIVGGAEAATFDLIQALLKEDSGYEIEVLTTDLQEFSADWDHPYHLQGSSVQHGVTVRRFPTQARNREAFHYLNGHFLMPGGTTELKSRLAGKQHSPVPWWAEYYYLRNMIDSPDLYRFLARNARNYDACIFVPYMFKFSVMGSLIMRQRALVMPCLHDERYAYMGVFRKAFLKARGMLCLVRSEQQLAEQLFPGVSKDTIGAVVDCDVAAGDPAVFQQRFGISQPFILYSGRQISGKNLPLLAERFQAYKARRPDSNLKLVLTGKGDLDYSADPDIINLGFVSSEEKSNALAAAVCLCQPSLNESFSLVIMESWLQKSPVLVHEDCEVTRDHALDSGGGFTFGDQLSFDKAMDTLLESAELRDRMGAKGRSYVLERYRDNQVAAQFGKALQKFGLSS